MSFSCGAGGIAGPYLGGILGAKGDYFVGARFATLGCLVAAMLVMLLPARIDTSDKVNPLGLGLGLRMTPRTRSTLGSETLYKPP